MWDCAHSVDQAECEKLEEMQLERSGSAALAKVEDSEVLVVIVLQQVSDYAEEVEQIDLQEALVHIIAKFFGFRLEQERDYLSCSDCNCLAPRLR